MPSHTLGYTCRRTFAAELLADLWQFLLQEKGLIYTSEHEGWYSISDEAFYPVSAIAPKLDPQTGRKLMVCIQLIPITAPAADNVPGLSRDGKRGRVVLRAELPLSLIAVH